MGNYQIFISYRRDGGEFLAGRISDKLTAKGFSVFYDVESMRSGPFNEQIYFAIDQCEDVLLVLPPNALDRCVDENDWVRKEIEYSLKKGKNIIPVLMRNFSFPENMPESIKAIAMREGIIADSNYFDAMIDRIQSLLQSTTKQNGNQENTDFKNGVRFLSRKLFPSAISCFEKVIQNDVSNPDAYFFAAIAMLEGKRPFLMSRSVINKIENYIESANAFGERAIYYYFCAYIKYDYYEKKFLKTAPTYIELLTRSYELGVTDAEINDLFDTLNVQKPDVFNAFGK